MIKTSLLFFYVKKTFRMGFSSEIDAIQLSRSFVRLFACIWSTHLRITHSSGVLFTTQTHLYNCDTTENNAQQYSRDVPMTVSLQKTLDASCFASFIRFAFRCVFSSLCWLNCSQFVSCDPHYVNWYLKKKKETLFILRSIFSQVSSEVLLPRLKAASNSLQFLMFVCATIFFFLKLNFV